MAAATSQVKLCRYDEEEPAIWFRLLKAQFAAMGIKSQKLRYGNALASLPKQVLRDILGTVNICTESDQPFDLLKEILLGQFRKSKWQSYFELLRLPMEVQGLKPSVLIGKLMQHLSHGVSPDNNLFLAMFLIRLPPSMREAVGAGNHKTAMAMIRSADALWDAWGGHDPAVAAATTQRSRSPAPASRKKNHRRNGNTCFKSRSPPTQWNGLGTSKAGAGRTVVAEYTPLLQLVFGQIKTFLGVIIESKYHQNTRFYTFHKKDLFKSLTFSYIIDLF